jgi:hypothetical protein
MISGFPFPPGAAVALVFRRYLGEECGAGVLTTKGREGSKPEKALIVGLFFLSWTEILHLGFCLILCATPKTIEIAFTEVS